jgi:hypothetical protein
MEIDSTFILKILIWGRANSRLLHSQLFNFAPSSLPSQRAKKADSAKSITLACKSSTLNIF